MRLQAMPGTAAKTAKILDDEHRLTTILAVLNSNRERLMVLLSLKAGLRAVEIASLTWGCIRESDTVIELIRTKGGKARSVPINKDLKKALRDYRADCKRTNDKDQLFRSRHKDPTAPLSANAVAQWLHSSRLSRYRFTSAARRRSSTCGGTLISRGRTEARSSMRALRFQS